MKVAIDVAARVEPGFLPRLERLARWDATSIDTIRSSYAAVAPPPSPPTPEVHRTDDVIPGVDDRPAVRVRWYRPAAAAGPLPCLVYFHGGAYIMGTLGENDDRLDLLAQELRCAVVSVDWRLAPEHPYPAGLDDADTVWRQISTRASAYEVDATRMVIGGASAGAGLATAECLRLRDAGLPQPALQLLIYPMLDDRKHWPAIRALEGGSGHWGLWPLRAERLAWEAYHRAVEGDIPATAAPGRADDLASLAPAFVGVGDMDAYVDANVDYALRLARAGVPTELHVYPGVIHGGFLARPTTPRTRQFLDDAYRALRLAFEGER